ncbi:MAG TPA: cyclic nucleotide-binding domain-containing protein, partial [Anaerolineales bacterium]
MNLHDLRKSPLFEGLSDEELNQLMDMAEPLSLHAGDVLIKQGEPGDAAYVVMRGEFEVQKQSGPSLIKIDVRNPGDMVGEMALLSRAPRNATLIAKTDGEVLRIPQEAFERLLQSSTSAAMAVLHWVMSRLIQNESLLHQQEKMAALGTMSAGLAHELNNPAAAAQRSAAQLRDSQSRWLTLTHQIESTAFQQGQSEWLDGFIQEATRRFGSPVKLDALERIDRVDQLQAWLEGMGVETPWELAPAMVNFGWESGSLEKIKLDLSPSLFALSVQWLGICCLMMGLLSEVLQTTDRISQIVRAVKSYAYLDQAPLL